MTFAQARAISKTNKLHVRRASWTNDKWFMLWRGTWFVFGTGLLKPVHATDYTTADLLATDWTTVPAPLVSCPVTPGEPLGGGPPMPGTPGWPGGEPDVPPFFPGSPGGSGSPSITLPPPDPGTDQPIHVVFIEMDYPFSIPPGHYSQGDIMKEGGWLAESVGAKHWKAEFLTGNIFSGDTIVGDINWILDVVRGPSGFTISLTTDSGAGGFSGGPVLRNQEATNTFTGGEINGGTAKVL